MLLQKLLIICSDVCYHLAITKSESKTKNISTHFLQKFFAHHSESHALERCLMLTPGSAHFSAPPFGALAHPSVLTKRVVSGIELKIDLFGPFRGLAHVQLLGAGFVPWRFSRALTQLWYWWNSYHFPEISSDLQSIFYSWTLLWRLDAHFVPWRFSRGLTHFPFVDRISQFFKFPPVLKTLEHLNSLKRPLAPFQCPDVFLVPRRIPRAD